MLSKIFERAVHEQMKHYLDKRGILFGHQSGFRGKFSTDTCLIDLSDFLRTEMSKGNLIGMICIDLQKAFDTVHHGTLLEKLKAIGVSDSALSWFSSYLSCRRQCVEVDGCRSEFMDVTCGVPQGSILGPQLFLIYINDMYSCLECRLSLYADDSALFMAHKDASFIANQLSTELSKCRKWLIDNKLSLHMGKTESLLFGTRKRLKSVLNYQVFCDGTAIKQVQSFRYLGVKLDSSMSGEAHAREVIGKCNGRLSFLHRYSSLLDEQTKRILCSSLIQPLVDYCCSSWYTGLPMILKKRFEVLQRRMVRFIFCYDSRAHVDSANLKVMSWMLVSDRVAFFKLLHVFKIKHALAPSYLSERFTAVEQTHAYNTRSRGRNFSISSSNSCSLTTFSYSAAKLWNDLPIHLKEIESLSCFRRRLRDFILQSY